VIKKNLLLSFSGGRTSAYMTHWMLENKRDDYNEVVVVFANTGQENEQTLDFVNRCDKEWNLGVVWLEADVIHEANKGTSFKIVRFETASRKGDPFEQVIVKYGIPNQSYPHCTRELKLQPMKSYLRSIGWNKGNYVSAIGIRIDEMDRVNSKMVEENLIYPLIEYTKATKELINLWWDRQPFKLELKEHQGNCSWCWKKSKRKLLTLAKESPEIFEFPKAMEARYGLNGSNTDGTHRVFFRNNTSTIDLIEQSKKPFEPFIEQRINFDMFDYELDSPSGCSESCEVY
jgi:hypothetical protein